MKLSNLATMLVAALMLGVTGTPSAGATAPDHLVGGSIYCEGRSDGFHVGKQDTGRPNDLNPWIAFADMDCGGNGYFEVHVGQQQFCMAEIEAGTWFMGADCPYGGGTPIGPLVLGELGGSSGYCDGESGYVYATGDPPNVHWTGSEAIEAFITQGGNCGGDGFLEVHVGSGEFQVCIREDPTNPTGVKVETGSATSNGCSTRGTP